MIRSSRYAFDRRLFAIAEQETRLAASRRLGELEAQAHDLELRLRESVAREQRLVDLASRSEAVAEELRRNDREMRARIERYSRFHEDLEHSRIWRLIQSARRLFGREW